MINRNKAKTNVLCSLFNAAHHGWKVFVILAKEIINAKIA
jgi:hypothetical protein